MARDDQDHQSEGCPGIKPPDPSSQLHPAQPRRSEVPANFQSPHLRAILWFPIGNNRIEVSLSASRPRVTGTWPLRAACRSSSLSFSHACTHMHSERDREKHAKLQHAYTFEKMRNPPKLFLSHTHTSTDTQLCFFLSLSLGVVVNSVEGTYTEP